MTRKTEYAEQLDEANETILQLKSAMRLDNWALYEGLRLTHNDGVILRALLQEDGACVRWRLLDRLNLMSRSGTIYDTVHLHIIVHRLRRKLKKFGITVKSERGVGFSMSTEDKAKFLALKRLPLAA
jgi:DNA-binding response OmpR family regulator